MKIIKLLLIALFFTMGSCNSDSKDNVIVFVKYKTQPNKNVDAVVALKTLISKVEKEKHFKKINMYIDPNDNSNILLCEEWEDENYYKNEHMETEHLKKFINESSEFLAAPPEISFWRLNSTFK
jgi:quinol monooxygenase YgiN